ncbi:hypothetical protein E2C01_008801 [Portunus trituberculatus]|uniref:Uncharacterized protein n=1 Tax=Portunus trituberculatus TaxID=210409 RepID=A0A5B7D4S6_PORTR|nr:hypothetical protein [Portunus trituberculatus]
MKEEDSKWASLGTHTCTHTRTNLKTSLYRNTINASSTRRSDMFRERQRDPITPLAAPRLPRACH